MAELISHAELLQRLHYDAETGVFTWLLDTDGARAGAIAGHCDSKGYVRIHFAKKNYLAHRLAWFYVHGEWPLRGLDHINRISSDNRISNLRLATYHQNGANADKRRTNTTGFKGVQRTKEGRYRAVCATIYLGTFGAPEEAHEAYLAFAKERYGEYAHGGSAALAIARGEDGK